MSEFDERRARDLLERVAEAPLRRQHAVVFLLCSAVAFFDYMDLQQMALIAPVVAREWGLSPLAVGTLSAAAMGGMFVGALAFGRLADRIGRWPCLQVGLVVIGIASATCAVTSGPTGLFVARFAVGIGIGGVIPIVTSLLYEFAPSRWRGRAVALWATSFPLGALAAAGTFALVEPVAGWPGVFVSGALPLLLVPAARWWVPETPAFLVAAGRLDEAGRAVGWVAPERAAGTSPARADPGSITDIEQAATAGGLFSGANRRVTVVLGSLWFAWSLAYFGLALWLPTLLQWRGMPAGTALAYVAGFNLAAVAGRLVSVVVIDWFSRAVFVGVGSLLAAGLSVAFGSQRGIIALILLGYALSIVQDGSFSALVSYTPSVYPARLRSSGVGWANAFGRLASIVAPVAVSGAVVSWGSGSVYLGIAGCYTVAGIGVALLPRPGVARSATGAATLVRSRVG